MSDPTTYLITGGNRGLGRGLVTHYLSRPNTVVIAAVRNLSDPTSLELSSLPHNPSSKLIILRIDSAIPEDIAVALLSLEHKEKIHHLDVVIPVAGIAKLALLKDLHITELQEHVEINALSVLRFYQACRPLMERSKKNPRFVLIGAAAGSFGMMQTFPFPNTSYSVTKLMAHWLVRKMHMEDEWLIAFSIHPGWVQTDMGNEGARAAGMDKAAVTIKDSVAGLVKAIDNSDRSTGFAPFHDFEGKTIPF